MKKVKKPALRVVTRITEAEKRSMPKLFEEGKMPIDVSQTLGRDLSTVARHYNRWEIEEESPVLAGAGAQGLSLGIWRCVWRVVALVGRWGLAL